MVACWTPSAVAAAGVRMVGETGVWDGCGCRVGGGPRGSSAAVMLPRRRAARAFRGVMTCQVRSSGGGWGPGVAAAIAVASDCAARRMKKLWCNVRLIYGF